MRPQRLLFEGTSKETSCAYTTVANMIVLIAEELAFVFIRGGKISAHCANQAGKARLALVKAAAWAVGA